ncbi:MAG: hypothetical protein RMJ51_01175 [Candidatus Calescibacterium sp.]|nr:hypothetical protein [Candidatus Calescibacterium sp.]MDW8194844.1 hypothetical protein [Candidatus Calescibacterium sp.]
MTGFIKVFLMTICFVCIWLFFVNAQDRVYRAVSTDGSPSFQEVVSHIYGNSFTNDSAISNSYVLVNENQWLWDHNFAVYVYDQISSTFVNNAQITNRADFINRTYPNNFMNVAAWVGYNWNSGSQTSSIQNNGILGNIIYLSNHNGGNFFNYSLYSSNSNPTIINRGTIDNIIDISDSYNIQNLYNFSMSSYNSQTRDIIENYGEINNIIRANNLQISNSSSYQGIFNYSIHSFSENSLEVSIKNDGTINTSSYIFSSFSPVIRNQSMLVANLSSYLSRVEILNTGFCVSNLTLIDSNSNAISNDGIAIYNSVESIVQNIGSIDVKTSLTNSNFNNISIHGIATYNSTQSIVRNTGSIVVNTFLDSSFTGEIKSISGIYFENIGSGSIENIGNISMLGDLPNNYVGAGIRLYQSGFTSPIRISTPVLMDLDPGYRSIILDGSNAELLSFGLYIDGDPTSPLYTRPILLMNSSELNLNNTILHLHIGNNIHLNKPYYIIENQGSIVTGEFDPNFIRYFNITNPSINVGWYNGLTGGDEVAIIFTYDPKMSISNNQQIAYSLVYRNLSDSLRDVIINDYHNLTSSIDRWQIGSYKFYEVIEGEKLGFEAKVYGKNIMINRIGEKYKYGGIISFGKMDSDSTEYSDMIYRARGKYFGYGVYGLKEIGNGYLVGIYHRMKMDTKYNSYTGLNMDIQERYKDKVDMSNAKIEYGFGNRSRIVLGLSKTIIEGYGYETNADYQLWNRRVEVESLDSTEGYIGFDILDKTKEDSYYFTIRLCQILSGDTVSSYEELQGNRENISQKIPRTNLKLGAYYKTSSNIFLGLKAEINKDYQKYAIKVGKYF